MTLAATADTDFRSAAETGALRVVTSADADTISATEFARRTGVGRERLRTWERRHGFPASLRARNGTRRYRLTDVPDTVLAAHLLASGVPLATAIEQARERGGAPVAITSLGAALDAVEVPALAVTGPEPLEVAWANAKGGLATQGAADAVVAGLGHRARASLVELLTAVDAAVAVLDHVEWPGEQVEDSAALAWRMPATDDGRPVVVILALPEAEAAGVGPIAAELPAQTATWAPALAAARRALQHDDGLASLQTALRALATGTGAADGALAVLTGGGIRTATSVRRRVRGHATTVDAVPAVRHAMAGGELGWLTWDGAATFGLGGHGPVAVIPLVAGGASQGVALLAFPEGMRIGEADRELLLAFGLMAGASLAREREARSARTARAAGTHAEQVAVVAPVPAGAGASSSAARRVAQTTAAPARRVRTAEEAMAA